MIASACDLASREAAPTDTPLMLSSPAVSAPATAVPCTDDCAHMPSAVDLVLAMSSMAMVWP